MEIKEENLSTLGTCFVAMTRLASSGAHLSLDDNLTLEMLQTIHELQKHFQKALNETIDANKEEG